MTRPFRLKAGDLRQTVRIEQPTEDTSFDGAGSSGWALVAQVAAEVQDMLPSRGERLADGINLATRPARVRMRFRSDVKPSMRFVMGATVNGSTVTYENARIMQIVAGPAQLGNRDGLEFIAEDYSTAGGGA